MNAFKRVLAEEGCCVPFASPLNTVKMITEITCLADAALGVVLLKVLQWPKAFQINTKYTDIHTHKLLHTMEIRHKDCSCNNTTEKESDFSECQLCNW